MKTYNDLYLDNKHALQNIGDENAQFEARLILAQSAGKSVSQILSCRDLYVNSEVEENNTSFMNRLLKGEPIAYILNNWEFYGLPFYVDSNVLIPRIDTETVIDTIKKLFPDSKAKLRILDLCTGSGNIACTLAYYFPNCHVTAIDYSQSALDICKKNILDLRLGGQVSCIRADVKNKPDTKLGLYDLIVSNPPYIRTEEIKTLDASVRDYEPHMALDGGKDGYDFYKAIITNYSILLKSDCYMIFEVGEEQFKNVSKLFIDFGYSSSNTVKDSAGTERVVIGKK